MLTIAMSGELGFIDAAQDSKIFLLWCLHSRVLWTSSSVGATELPRTGLEVVTGSSAPLALDGHGYI